MSKKSLQFSFDINSNNFDFQRHHRWINYENDEKREVFELSRIREFQSRILKISINVINEKLACDHLILSCKLINNDISINFYFMIDNDTTNIDFIDDSFAHYHEFSRTLLSNSRFLIVVDDKNFASSNVTHIVRILFMIRNHLETIVLFVIKLKHYFVILNMFWFKLHDFFIHWNRNVVFFSFFHCTKHCLRLAQFVIVFDVDQQLHQLFQFFNSLNISNENLKLNQAFLTNIDVIEIKWSRTFSFSIHRIEIAIKITNFKQMYKKLALSKDYVALISFKNIKKYARVSLKKDIKSLNISFINAISFNTWLNKSKKNKSIEVYSIFIHDIEQILQEKKIIDSLVKLFAKHHDHVEIFFKKISNQLSMHRLYDYKILFIKSVKFVNDSLYEMFKKELKIIMKYIEKMLKKTLLKQIRRQQLISYCLSKNQKMNFVFAWIIDNSISSLLKTNIYYRLSKKH